MINGAMSYILPDVLAQMDQFGLDPGKITKFLILHSISITSESYPISSEPIRHRSHRLSAGVEDIRHAKAIEIMNSFSRISAKQVGAEEALKAYDLEWRDDMTVSPLGRGQNRLGGVTLTLMDTPAIPIAPLRLMSRISRPCSPRMRQEFLTKTRSFPP